MFLGTAKRAKAFHETAQFLESTALFSFSFSMEKNSFSSNDCVPSETYKQKTHVLTAQCSRIYDYVERRVSVRPFFVRPSFGARFADAFSTYSSRAKRTSNSS